MGNVCGGPGDREEEEQLAFMTCILKVKSMKQGWESSVRRVLRSCKEVRFQMDEKGIVEINGIGNPEIVLKKISRSSNIELHWYQFGQCSANLFMQQQKQQKKEERELETPNNNNNNKAAVGIQNPQLLIPPHPHTHTRYANPNPNPNLPLFRHY